MDKVRLGLCGAGRIGSIHGENAAHFIEGAELVVIADPNLEAAEALAGRTGARAAEDAAAVVEADDVDAVLICSATDTHADLIERAARAGKHVFCEKPLALDLETIDRALGVVEEAGVQLMVGFNRRFDPGFAAVQAQVQAGDVGDVHLVRITSRDPSPPPLDYVKVSGGIFLDMTIHDFDMARFLVGREVTKVYAAGACRVDPGIGALGDVDTAAITLTFDDGTLCTIDNSRQAVYGYDQRVEVFGARGSVWADNRFAHDTGGLTADGRVGPKPLHFFLERYAEAYRRELRAFVDALRAGAPVPVTGDDGRAPVALALAAGRSLEEGRAVDVD
jgi:myo-inositol 2-dehydrogenase/D-chiro-inositol 1-dehydrogenase